MRDGSAKSRWLLVRLSLHTVSKGESVVVFAVLLEFVMTLQALGDAYPGAIPLPLR